MSKSRRSFTAEFQRGSSRNIVAGLPSDGGWFRLKMRCFWDGNTFRALLSFAGSGSGLAGGGCGSFARGATGGDPD